MQIIHKKSLPVESLWQKELAKSFTELSELLDFLQIEPSSTSIPPDIKSSLFANQEPSKNEIISVHTKARKLFAMRVPRPFANLMQKGNWHDPLLQQVLPQYAEFNEVSGFVSDPLQEHTNKVSGLIHKYKSRVLLIVRGGCAVNCRYCFRREFPYQDNHLNKQQYQEVLQYIEKDRHLNEVILSGGDPLMANDEQLAYLISQIENIKHVKRLRIHTRLPVVIPQRVTAPLINTLANTPLNVIVVLHINHANEISPILADKLLALKQVGVTLFNQAVLLKNINDNAKALVTLSETLFDAHVLPYYLYLLDPVKGAAHFDVSESSGQQLMHELIAQLPGFLVPKLVREVPKREGKTPIDLKLS